MKVLGVVCSPRLGGNTEVLVKEALDSAKEAGAEVELVTLAGKTIAPCDGCLTCDETGECRINDDMQEVYPKLLEADGIILGTPVYFWSVSGQAKVLIDRTYPLFIKRRLRDKVGGIVVVAGYSGRSSTFTIFHNFFNIQRMVMAGGATGLGYQKAEIKQDERALSEAKAVGRAVVRRIKKSLGK